MKTVLLAGASSICLIAPGVALAQTSGDPIEYCRENTDGKKERIACLEAAILGLMGRDVAGADGEQTKTADAGDAVVEEADPDAPVGLGAEQVQRRREQLGLLDEEEKQKKEKKRKERITSKITDFATTSAGYFIIFLENGQVWRQRKSDSVVVRLSKYKEYEVEIKRGAISGYRMVIPGASRTIVVERLK